MPIHSPETISYTDRPLSVYDDNTKQLQPTGICGAFILCSYSVFTYFIFFCEKMLQMPHCAGGA